MFSRELDRNDTIFALATGSLPSAIAITRLSGPKALEIYSRLFSGPRERGMYVGELRSDGQTLDEIVALVFPGPNSYTGEDLVEFQTHGSLAVVRQLEKALVGLGARRAARGEFTFRSLLNRKQSGEDVEQLGDVFLARTDDDLRAIYSRRDDSTAAILARLRDQLLTIQAILDTSVDFSDEYSSVVRAAREPLEAAIRECSLTIHRYSLLKSGDSEPKLVLAGRPNAGKSSLFNAILCRKRAIVHEQPGTTRDVIEEAIEIGGRPWRLVDTAGFREAEGNVERDGMELGQDYLSGASAWILVVDGTAGLGDVEARLLAEHGAKPHLVVWNKADLADLRDPNPRLLAVSARTGLGVEALVTEIGHAFGEVVGSGGQAVPTATEALRLGRVLETLQDVAGKLDSNPPEISSEGVRRALVSLECVLGPVDMEDVLDRVFAEFCVGK